MDHQFQLVMTWTKNSFLRLSKDFGVLNVSFFHVQAGGLTCQALKATNSSAHPCFTNV